jgi:hypothetical protein
VVESQLEIYTVKNNMLNTTVLILICQRTAMPPVMISTKPVPQVSGKRSRELLNYKINFHIRLNLHKMLGQPNIIKRVEDCSQL